MEWYDIDYMEQLTRFERTSVEARPKREALSSSTSRPPRALARSDRAWAGRKAMNAKLVRSVFMLVEFSLRGCRAHVRDVRARNRPQIAWFRRYWEKLDATVS